MVDSSKDQATPKEPVVVQPLTAGTTTGSRWRPQTARRAAAIRAATR